MKAYLEAKEVNLMEKAANCLRDRLLVRILFHLGCRISEALEERKALGYGRQQSLI
jgi:integrase/recombinase XerD